MRLLNASTLQFEEYFGDLIPHYAILSHTWGKQEVTYQDFDLGRKKAKIGYQKVLNTCERGLIYNLTYVWIDTCCIDKRSSAELSEAINSMFNWYARSKVCYAYIEDARNFDLKIKRDVKEFTGCRWFSRGWTLQELILPPEVVFLSGSWNKFGTRRSISSILSKITGIDLEILENPTSEHLFEVSIAKRMSWASRRETTRVEDMAYCLLGIFDVHMPLLYGEGGRAFRRLQEEIMKHTHDHSLLAWGQFFNGSDVISRRNKGELLAKSPAAFKSSRNIVSFPPRHEAALSAITNRGLNIELATRRTSEHHAIALLNCYLPTDLDRQLAILISGPQSLGRRYDDKLYFFPRSEIEFGDQDSSFKFEIIYFPDSIHQIDVYKADPRTDFLFISRRNGNSITKVEPSSQWDSGRHLIRSPQFIPFAGCHVTIHLDYELPMKEKIHSKPKLVIYTRYIIGGPDPFLATSCSIRRITAEMEAHENISDYRDFGSNATIQVTEDGVTFEISIKLVWENVMGQPMEVLYIGRPTVVRWVYGGQ